MKLKEAIRILKNHNCWRRWITWYTMTTPKKLWIAIDTIVNHYEKWYESISIDEVCLQELKFANLQKQHFESILDEVEVLVSKWIKKELIQEVIKNWKLRWMLDLSIHYDMMCGWIDNNNLKKMLWNQVVEI
jgi:hypothetical protein